MGHLCGALGGLLVGIFILDNRRVSSWEPIVQWISFALYCAFIIFAVLWNVWGNEWSGSQFYPVPKYNDESDGADTCRHYSWP